MITLVGDKEVAAPIHRNPGWEIQAGSSGRSTIAGESLHSVARNRGNRPQSVDLTNAVIRGVRDEEVACLIHGHAEWSTQTGASGCSMVT